MKIEARNREEDLHIRRKIKEYTKDIIKLCVVEKKREIIKDKLKDKCKELEY